VRKILIALVMGLVIGMCGVASAQYTQADGSLALDVGVGGATVTFLTKATPGQLDSLCIVNEGTNDVYYKFGVAGSSVTAVTTTAVLKKNDVYCPAGLTEQIKKIGFKTASGSVRVTVHVLKSTR